MFDLEAFIRGYIGCALWSSVDEYGEPLNAVFSRDDLSTEAPEGHFDMGEEANAEVLDGIASGRYLWFCARVTASKAGVELAESFLGGCCYESAADFMDEDSYWGNMVREVIDEARAKIRELAA